MPNDSSRRRVVSALLSAPFAWRAAQAQGQIPRFAYVTHSPTSETWWNPVKNALLHAGEDFGVAVDYINPLDGSIAEMARLIRSISPRNYAAIMSTIGDFNALREPLSEIVHARQLPLITVNSGTQAESERIGALMHVGQPEYEAGKAAGDMARKRGVKSYLCVNSFATNPVSFERCRGFGDAIGADYKKSTIDSGEDPTGIESKVSAYLRQNPTTDAVLTLGPTSAHPTLRALEKMGRRGIFFATFDLSSEITRAIRDGSIQFAIDQQPYLQGYLPVALLAEYIRAPTGTSMRLVKFMVFANEKLHRRMARYGLELKPSQGQHVNSGPGLVNRINLEKVERYAGQFR